MPWDRREWITVLYCRQSRPVTCPRIWGVGHCARVCRIDCARSFCGPWLAHCSFIRVKGHHGAHGTASVLQSAGRDILKYRVICDRHHWIDRLEGNLWCWTGARLLELCPRHHCTRLKLQLGFLAMVADSLSSGVVPHACSIFEQSICARARRGTSKSPRS
jgi:hypothetical protein